MKKVKYMAPLFLGIALLAFMVGMMIATSLKITPTVKAVAQEPLEEGASPTKDKQVFVTLAAKCMPATVNISTTKVVKRRDKPSYHPFGGGDFLNS